MLAWVGAAVTALWILRFGFNAALPVFAAGLAGAAGWALRGELGPINNLLAATILAIVLRGTRNWSATLLLLPLAVGGLYAALMLVSPGYIDSLQQMLAQVFEQFKQEFISQLDVENTSPEQIDAIRDWPVPDGWSMLGWFAAMQSGMTILSLLVARWWQALLYNPGGFAIEMAALRFNAVHAVVLVAAAGVMLSSFDGNWWSLSWFGLCVLPLGFVGFVLAHRLLTGRRGSVFWKFVFYATLLVWFPFSVAALAGLAVVDSFVGIGKRIDRS